MDRSDLLAVAEEKGLQGKLLRDELLCRHTSYRIGGPADFYIMVENVEQLCGWVGAARELKEPYMIMGGGTNLLVADKGFRGLVIENRCPDFALDVESQIVRAQTGVSLASLARKTANQGFSGLEWAIGIPGTVGGSIVNNAGAFDRAVADVLRQFTVLDKEGRIRTLTGEQAQFGYRSSRFRSQEADGEVILSTEFTLAPESWRVLRARMAQYRALRRASQPRQPSAGSVFKNPPGSSAGQLIEQAGLKGKTVGNAQVSPGHANYIVNLGKAKAEEVLELIELTRLEIWQRFQVELELEIELVGEWEKAATI